jgi:hypothetical protein
MSHQSMKSITDAGVRIWYGARLFVRTVGFKDQG